VAFYGLKWVKIRYGSAGKLIIFGQTIFVKPIEFCLDTLLSKLKESWELTERPPLDAEALLRDFEVPQERHEFFKGLMRMLIEDKYAYPINSYNPGNPVSSELDYYTKRIMLAPLGFYFIEQGGYSQRKINNDAESTRVGKLETNQMANQRRMIWLTAILAVGTTLAAIYYCVELYWNHGWFHFGFPPCH